QHIVYEESKKLILKARKKLETYRGSWFLEGDVLLCMGRERDLCLLGLLHSIRQSSIICNIKCSIRGKTPDASGYHEYDYNLRAMA
ncbi:MAG: hypothetical protein LBF75_07500, partial [Treponema sp.]|nr:hypothetical protein [Treponema sp.]